MLTYNTNSNTGPVCGGRANEIGQMVGGWEKWTAVESKKVESE